MGIAFWKGDERISAYQIEASMDGTNWFTVVESGKSTVTTNMFGVDLGNIDARYVKFIGNGNTSANSSRWNSVLEIAFFPPTETGEMILPEVENGTIVDIELPQEVLDAIEDLKTIYDDKLIDFLAGLYDPETEAFYHAYSARGTKGYLPDVESTAKIFNALDTFCEPGKLLTEYMPENYGKTLVTWVQSLEDESDGYFYHPQWGKTINDSKRGRDLGWAVGLLARFGAEPLYPTALDRLSGSVEVAVASTENQAKTESTLPSYLQNKDNFLQWISALPWKNDPYSAGNSVNAITDQIIAAGLEQVAIEYLNSIQDPVTGLWGDGIDYRTVSAVMKLAAIYGGAGADFNHAEEALQSCINVVLSDELDESTQITFLYNPWSAISSLRTLVKVEDEIPEWFNEKLYSNAPAMIKKTKEKLEVFKKDDGGFSYLPYKATWGIQSSPACLGLAEGDVDATCIAVNGVIRTIYLGLGVPNEAVFKSEDVVRFWEKVKSITTSPDKMTAEEYIAGCKHEMSKTEATVTCETAGHNEYWFCTKCERYYLDQMGKVETTKDAAEKEVTAQHIYTDELDTECGRCGKTRTVAYTKIDFDDLDDITLINNGDGKSYKTNITVLNSKSEEFNSEIVAGVSANLGSTVEIKTVATAEDADNKALVFNSIANGGESASISLPKSNENEAVAVEFKLMYGGAMKEGKRLGVSLAYNDTSKYMYRIVGNPLSGTETLCVGDYNIEGASFFVDSFGNRRLFDANRWYKFRINFMPAEKKAIVYIDDELAVESYNFENFQNYTDGIRLNSFSGATGSIYIDDIIISQGVIENEEGGSGESTECTHTLVKTEAKAATSTEDGNIAYWTCSKPECGKMFSDENGTTEVTAEETVIKAHEHSYTDDLDTICDITGCGETRTVAYTKIDFDDLDDITLINNGDGKSYKTNITVLNSKSEEFNSEIIARVSANMGSKVEVKKVETAENAGNKALAFTKVCTTGGEQASISLPVSQSGKSVTVEYKIMLSGDIKADARMTASLMYDGAYVYQLSANPLSGLATYNLGDNDSSSTTTYFTNETNQNLTYNTNEWYTVKVQYVPGDTTATAYVYINDVLVKESTNMYTVKDKIDGLRFGGFSASTGTIYVDDIKISMSDVSE